MIKIRHGLWETNSSSVHAICLHKQKNLAICDYVYFGLESVTDEYEDWNTIQRRANYLNTIMYMCLSKTNYIQERNRIKKILKSHNVESEWAECKWGKDGFAYYDDYDIKDSCSDVILNVIIKDETILLQYLFGDNSQIIMGYDDLFDERLKKAKNKYPEGEEYDYLFEEW